MTSTTLPRRPKWMTPRVYWELIKLREHSPDIYRALIATLAERKPGYFR